MLWMVNIDCSKTTIITLLCEILTMPIKKSNYIATSRWVKAARKKKKLTQKDLADKLKISKRSLENYEAGVVDVPTSIAIALEKICELPPPFFGSSNKDQSKKIGGDKDEGINSDPDTTKKYISLLEQTIEKLEEENEELKKQIKKSSANLKNR
jgi:transcriptional regulator with XRE-family HTH domain